jgi:hypothetical protein
MSLQAEILNGLDIVDWDESIASVKRLVVNALRTLDRGVDIKDTRYTPSTCADSWHSRMPRPGA